ncbi:MAG TPA: patatin, partial [Gammaproteobacteria bacterium]|nr:patatin [Gammaproteobacteria bacterium]
ALPQVTAILFACAVSLGAVVLSFWRTTLRHLPRNNFGICSGMPTAADASPGEALTPWLHTYYNDLCKQEQRFTSSSGTEHPKPLTFGDLKTANIDLQMMTTCLTLGRPFRLPFRDDHQVRENKLFWYKESEFRELFPESVVDWMVLHERHYRARTEPHRLQHVSFEGFRCLPSPEDLPVVVAVRMSLSFPILLSAVPLYSVDFRKPDEELTLERCWFSDGGIGANFPIHFFDSPLPSRPTFGLDLGERSEITDKAVVLPARNADARLAYWRRIESSGLKGIIRFLGSVVNVAKDWNHETLGHMPGFRDRIALIRLSREEGGLNLVMSEQQITKLSEYGREAGREFVRRFGKPRDPSVPPATTMNWENHQLVRLRLLLAALSEYLVALNESAQQADALGFPYERFFHGGDDGPVRYRFKGRHDHTRDPQTHCEVTQAGLARALYDGLRALGEHTSRCTLSDSTEPSRLSPATGAPKPPPELRLRPRV